MDCLLDNIIFSLQKSGGASVVWQEHISRLLLDDEINTTFLEYSNAKKNLFRKEVNIPDTYIREKSHLGLSLLRYIDLNTNDKCRHIFHSSHYRINKNKRAVNVTTVHDFTYEYFVRGIRRKVHSAQKHHAILNSDAVICVSESTRNDLLKFIPKMDEEKLFVVHNGVSPSFSLISANNYSLSIPFDNHGYILYVGSRHTPYKNFSVVIEVCKQMKIPLVLVGGEKMSIEEFSFLNSTLKADFFIHYWGIDSNKLNELYNRALLLLYPSLYEGFGIPIIEAQKAGCPIIAYASSSIPEIVDNSGFVLPDISCSSIVDKISTIINSSGIRDLLIKEGLINSKRFSWDTTYKKTLGIYKKMMNI